MSMTEYSNEDVTLVVALCDKYLAWAPQHSFGFCWWAKSQVKSGHDHDRQINAVYNIVGEARLHWDNGPGFGVEMGSKLYASPWPSYNEPRAAFVRLLRANLRSYLGRQ